MLFLKKNGWKSNLNKTVIALRDVIKSSKGHNKLQIKVKLWPSKKNCFICFNESLLKMMKNAFYFITVFCFTLKALFVLKIFNFLSWLFVHVKKWLDYKDQFNFKIYDVTALLTNNSHITQYL